jgi:hypothetical protein
MSLSRVLSENVPVLVRNPSPGGGDSNSLGFTIMDNHTFYAPVKVSDIWISRYPNIAADSEGNINVVWEEDTLLVDAFFSRSINDGASWSEGLNITNASGCWWTAKPAIAVGSDGNINVVLFARGSFEDEESGIYFTRSTDNGENWSERVNISTLADFFSRFDIEVDNTGAINVIWNTDLSGNHEIYFSRSTDNGENWSEALNISNSSLDSLAPEITVDSSGNINVVWQEDTISSEYVVYFSRSTDNGENWSEALNISNTLGSSGAPGIAVDSDGNIGVIWSNGHSGNHEVYFSRSTDSGVNWSEAVNISNTLVNSRASGIAMDSARNINVVWLEGNSVIEYIIYFSRSTDNGASWSTALNISSPMEYPDVPVIAVDSAGNINVVWSNDSDTSIDIYFTGSTR